MPTNQPAKAQNATHQPESESAQPLVEKHPDLAKALDIHDGGVTAAVAATKAAEEPAQNDQLAMILFSAPKVGNQVDVFQESINNSDSPRKHLMLRLAKIRLGFRLRL